MPLSNIKSADLVQIAVKPDQYPDESLPEIAFAGRSNVGKSSLLNGIMNRKSLARTSSKPGKTRTINFYGVNDEIRLVDLPGYGFAKTSQENRDSWGAFIDDYIRKSPHLVMVGLLVDLRHPGLPIDMKAYEWLKRTASSLQIIGTKCDKLGKNELNKNLKLLSKSMPGEREPLPYSSLTGFGKEELLLRIEEEICREE